MDVIVPAVFVLCLGVILGGYFLLVVRPETSEDRTLRKRLRTRRGAPLGGAAIAKAEERLSSVGPLNRFLGRSGSVFESLRSLILRSGMSLTLGTLLLACVFLGLVAGIVVVFVSSSVAFGVVVGVLISPAPILVVRYKAAKRIAMFEDQFPEAIDLMGRALRAGHALTTALQMVGDEVPEPVGGEFRLLFEQQNYGMSLPDAMRAFAARLPLLDARFFVTAVLTQRETGGNLSEVLDNLASVIRERFKVKRQVRVMSAHGRMTGWVLGLLPPAMAVILFVISPDHMRLLIEDPIGVYMVTAAVVLQVVGVLAIRRIVDVEY